MAEVYSYAFRKVIEDHSLYQFDKQLQLKIIKQCIENGIDLNANESEELSVVISNENYDLLQFLLDSGMKISNNALLTICVFCHEETKPNLDIIKLLVERGVDIGANNNEAICLVCDFPDCLEAFQYLVSLGADPFAQNNKPLQQACWKLNIHLLKYLVTMGVNCLDRPWACLAVFQRECSAEFLKILLDHGASPNTKMGKHCPLDYALCHENYECCKLLLEYGADISLCSDLYQPFSIYHNKDRLQKIVDVFKIYGYDISSKMIPKKIE
jgi:ankyrin repeat protein